MKSKAIIPNSKDLLVRFKQFHLQKTAQKRLPKRIPTGGSTIPILQPPKVCTQVQRVSISGERSFFQILQSEWIVAKTSPLHFENVVDRSAASAPLKAFDQLGGSPDQGNVTALYPTVTAFQ